MVLFSKALIATSRGTPDTEAICLAIDGDGMVCATISWVGIGMSRVALETVEYCCVDKSAEGGSKWIGVRAMVFDDLGKDGRG